MENSKELFFFFFFFSGATDFSFLIFANTTLTSTILAPGNFRLVTTGPEGGDVLGLTGPSPAFVLDGGN